ncbi:hypothetical protein HHK36_031707 [Tetracentron sinense]|uniref:DUF4219 domain-containing protein n=1 Tax=Tetracentron sinense TaxID=13715 RepID=A0A834Y8K2_TETSI|nr:hypothetical protein HHK36_031707 [Tetracentron sinense]
MIVYYIGICSRMVGETSEPKTIVDAVLKRKNYDTWKVQMERHLKERRLWDIVNGTADSTDETWSQKNEQALKAIKNSCGPQKLSSIKKETSAKKAWDDLASLSHQKDQQVYASDIAHRRWWKVHDAMDESLQKFCGLLPRRKIELEWDRKKAGEKGLQDHHWRLNVTDPRRDM